LGKDAVDVGFEGTDDIGDLLFAALHVAASIALHSIAVFSIHESLYSCFIKLIQLIVNRHMSHRTHHRRIVRDLYFSIQRDGTGRWRWRRRHRRDGKSGAQHRGR
jgi:hypothetical protein